MCHRYSILHVRSSQTYTTAKHLRENRHKENHKHTKHNTIDSYLFDLFDIRVFMFMVDMVRPHSLLSFVQSYNLSRPTGQTFTEYYILYVIGLLLPGKHETLQSLTILCLHSKTQNTEGAAISS